MDVFNLFNKFSGKVTDYFSYIENTIQKPNKKITDNLLQINSNIILWVDDIDFPDSEYISLFKNDYEEKFLIYNMAPRKIDTELEQDKIVDFQLPKNPSFTLEFIIGFCISAENWLNVNSTNKLIFHDDLSVNEGKIFYLLSAIISYHNTRKTDSIYEPVSIYADLTSNFNDNEVFKNIDIFSDTKNNIRYLNYFSAIQKSPLISLKKLFLTNIMISGAPAIDNIENKDSGPFVTINKNSFYIPIIRIKSNGKYIYSSYNQKSSENKLIKMFHSEDNVVKFEINKYIFNDISVEVLHKGEKSFKLLFIIQFNSFFTTSNYSIKFSRDQIDSIHKDIRYPTDFFVDLFFDNEKEEKLSPFDEYSIVWKSLLSEFISKSLNSKKEKEKESEKDANSKKNSVDGTKDSQNWGVGSLPETINSNEKNEIKAENKEKEGESNSELNNEHNSSNKKGFNESETKEEEFLEIGNANNTIAEVNNLLKQIEGNNDNANNKVEEDDDEDEDIEKYLQNLESK